MDPAVSSRLPLKAARAGLLTAVVVALAVVSLLWSPERVAAQGSEPVGPEPVAELAFVGGTMPSGWLAGVGSGAILLGGFVVLNTRRRTEPILAEMRLLRPID